MAHASAMQAETAQQSMALLGDALPQVLDALARLRTESNATRVLEMSPQHLCASGVYDRVMLSWVRGSLWVPQTAYVTGSLGRTTLEVGEELEGHEIALASPLVEAEVVRRRLPALVQDARTEIRVWPALADRLGTDDYVVAPVVAGTAVVALLHAHTISGRALSTIDRDLLRMYSDGVGLTFERAQLAERAVQQGREVAEVCQAAAEALGALEVQPALRFGEQPPRRTSAAAVREPAEHRESGRLSRLTAREREVLALLATGATNSELANQLTVAESTVKSHVKHILHKLGAANRAAAIAGYLQETTPRRQR